MPYVYSQKPKPTSATGVSVSIDAIDPNGNFVHVGNAVSDANGFYCLQVNTNQLGAGPGTYKVIATFAGSESYGSSTAEAAFTVNPAPAQGGKVQPSIVPTAAPTAPPVVTPTPIVTQPPLVTPTPVVTAAPTPTVSFPATEVYIVSAAVIVIVIVAIAAIALRRRK